MVASLLRLICAALVLATSVARAEDTRAPDAAPLVDTAPGAPTPSPDVPAPADATATDATPAPSDGAASPDVSPRAETHDTQGGAVGPQHDASAAPRDTTSLPDTTSTASPQDAAPANDGDASTADEDTIDVAPALNETLGADAEGDSSDEAPDALDALDAQVDHDTNGTTPSLVEPPLKAHDDDHAGPDDPESMSSSEAIRAIFGLVLLLGLAYIGGHPRVQRLEQQLRISQVITAGFPFVLIGLISREDGLNILSEPVLDAIRPLLPIGLGWLGFAVGFRFDVRKLEKMPPLAGEAFVATTAVPYVFIVGTICAVLMLVNDTEPNLLILRDAFVLAAAGAMTAVTLPRLLERHGAARTDVDRVGRIIQLEELAALLGVLVIAAFFRPEVDTGWKLPSVGWAFVTAGAGMALSGVIYALLGTIKGSTETLIIMLGSICFTAGLASFLRLSPVVVCFIAGAVLQNFPGPWKVQVARALVRVERPVYLLFLLIAGALWQVDQWQGWVLMLAFVAARLFGRIAGVALFARRHPESLTPFERRHLAISPMGALSLAIIVTAQDLYSGPTVPWMVNAVIGGAILTEIIVQVFAFERPRSPKTRPTQTSMPAFVLEHADPPALPPAATRRPSAPEPDAAPPAANRDELETDSVADADEPELSVPEPEPTVPEPEPTVPEHELSAPKAEFPPPEPLAAK